MGATIVQLIGILGDPVPEGPILFWNLYEIDKYIFGTKPQSRMESVGYGLVKGFLLLNGSTYVKRQLDKDTILGAPDAKIVFVSDVGVSGMLGNDLKSVAPGCLEDIDHCLIDNVA